MTRPRKSWEPEYRFGGNPTDASVPPPLGEGASPWRVSTKSRRTRAPGKRRQRGYFYGPSTGELVGCLGAFVVFFIGVGVLLAWLLPLAWHWLKPILHGWTA